MGIILGIYSSVCDLTREIEIFEIRSWLLRLMEYFCIMLTPMAVCIIVMPKDLFCQFNMFPEQLSRVSIMQYLRINYRRFRTSDELLANPSFFFGKNKNMFGIEVNQTDSSTRITVLFADNAIDNEVIVNDLRVCSFLESLVVSNDSKGSLQHSSNQAF